MNEPTSSQKTETNRLQPGAVVAGLVLAMFVAAFGAMGWIRSRQSDEHGMSPSEIEALAGNHKPRDPLAESRERGRKVYRHYCTICHGDEGDGNGFNAAMLDPTPRNFTEPGFWKKRTEAQVSRVIHQGGPAVGKSVLMPAWGANAFRTANRRRHQLPADSETTSAEEADRTIAMRIGETSRDRRGAGLVSGMRQLLGPGE